MSSKTFQEIQEPRPSEMNKVDSPLFLAIKYKRAPDDNTWYMKCPLGKNQIGKFLSTAAKNVGIPQVSGAKVTNHSVRKTSISRLLDANMLENFVAQHSGHKSTESLQSYKSAGEKQQRQMSRVLSRVSSLDNTATSTSSGPTPSFLQMCQPNNQTSCTSVNIANESSDNSKNSSFFSGVHSVQGCSFQIFNEQVNLTSKTNVAV